MGHKVEEVEAFTLSTNCRLCTIIGIYHNRDIGFRV